MAADREQLPGGGRITLVLARLLLEQLRQPGFYLLGQRWGTVGLALTWVVVFPLLVLPAYRRVLQTIELSSREYLRTLWPAASASVAMAATVLVVQLTAGEHMSRALSFSAQVVAGAIVYAVVSIAMYRERLAAFFRLLRALRAPPQQPEGLAMGSVPTGGAQVSTAPF